MAEPAVKLEDGAGRLKNVSLNSWELAVVAFIVFCFCRYCNVCIMSEVFIHGRPYQASFSFIVPVKDRGGGSKINVDRLRW